MPLILNGYYNILNIVVSRNSIHIMWRKIFRLYSSTNVNMAELFISKLISYNYRIMTVSLVVMT